MLWPSDHRRSRARLARRRFVQAGALGMLGLGLPELLAGRAAQALEGGQREQPGARREKSCIFIVQYGGCSHIDTFDPKPAAPAEIRGPYQPIATSVPGVQFGDLLPRLATRAHRFALLRSLTHGTSDHDLGTHVCLTGHSRPTEQTPNYGAVLAKLRPAGEALPSYVFLNDIDRDVRPWWRTGGFLGAGYAPFVVGERNQTPDTPDFRVRTFDPAAGVSAEQVARRWSLLQDLQAARGSSPAGDGMRALQARAIELVAGDAARRAFDLGNEPAAMRDEYGRHPLGQNLLLARRLIEAGVRLVSVNAWLGVAKGHEFLVTQGWDMHGAEVQKCGIFSEGTFGLGFALPRFDRALSALLDDLEQRGLLEDTLVVVVGEFGRTPKIVASPYPGRDHWPGCYSALLAGAGVHGGATYGASDATGAYPKRHPVSPETFAATVYAALGLPPATRFGPDGFSIRVSDGEPLTELLSSG